MARSREISYQTTLYVRDQCLCLHAQGAARALARRFDEAFRTLELTNGQFSLLTALNRPQPPAMGSVAALLAMDRTTLTAALKPLQRRGWVVSSPDLNDRRNRLLSLTQAGRNLLAQAVPVWEATHGKVEEQLTARGGKRMRSSLRALCAAAP
ncbi:MAG: MarR family transcriptional regulator [Variovorax sp.]